MPCASARSAFGLRSCFPTLRGFQQQLKRFVSNAADVCCALLSEGKRVGVLCKGASRLRVWVSCQRGRIPNLFQRQLRANCRPRCVLALVGQSASPATAKSGAHAWLGEPLALQVLIRAMPGKMERALAIYCIVAVCLLWSADCTPFHLLYALALQRLVTFEWCRVMALQTFLKPARPLLYSNTGGMLLWPRVAVYLIPPWPAAAAAVELVRGAIPPAQAGFVHAGGRAAMPVSVSSGFLFRCVLSLTRRESRFTGLQSWSLPLSSLYVCRFTRAQFCVTCRFGWRLLWDTCVLPLRVSS